jgi:hypothetical protein
VTAQIVRDKAAAIDRASLRFQRHAGRGAALNRSKGVTTRRE